MGSVWIHERTIARDGSARFYVRFRAGGRSTSTTHLATFRCRRLAEQRAALAREYLSFGLDPRNLDQEEDLAALDQPDPVRPFLRIAAAVMAADQSGHYGVALRLTKAVLRREEGEDG